MGFFFTSSFYLLAFVVSSFSAEDVVYDIRDTTKGSVRGILNQTNFCREWRGVFFAADTGGSNRFMPPVERASWSPDILDATNFAAGCLQIHHNPDVPTNQSEDCLNLNVFAPAYCESGQCDLPVLIWYHGGTFTEGWNEGPFDLYDGCNLAQGSDVIVVTVNYRLGALGFLVTNEAEDDYNIKGNQGMKDQRAAMQWVHDNIGNFGGNNQAVTIFGQSAGAMSVGLHYVSEVQYTSNLFQRVITESNYPGSNIHDLDQASKLGNMFCEDLGCWTGEVETGTCDVSCMQNASSDDCIEAWKKSSGAYLPWVYDNIFQLLDGAMSFAPVVDNEFITCKITDCLEQNNFNSSIDIMYGTNAGDGATFVYYITVPIPYSLYEDTVRVIWNEPEGTADRILDYYEVLFPKNTTADGRVPLAQVVNDYLFRCSSEVYGNKVAAEGGNAFEYLFDYVYSDAYLFPLFGLPDICNEIACHSEEIMFVFNNTVPSLNTSFTPYEQQLAARMGSWWSNFAKYGNPNGQDGDFISDGDFPDWPKFDGTTREVLHISDDSFIETDGVDLCAGFWDSVGYLY